MSGTNGTKQSRVGPSSFREERELQGKAFPVF